jgi:hypothetical protein
MSTELTEKFKPTSEDWLIYYDGRTIDIALMGGAWLRNMNKNKAFNDTKKDGKNV